MAEGIETPPKFNSLTFLVTMFLQSLENRVAKVVITNPLVYPMVMTTLGPILPPKSLMLRLMHTMLCFKPWMMMTFLGKFIANPPLRFCLIWLLHTREHHKSREPKLISCVP